MQCPPIRNTGHFNPLPPHGGRLYKGGYSTIEANFNPLPPHGGRRWTNGGNFANGSFQSTPSTRRETLTSSSLPSMMHFNPLPPHGGRRIRISGCSCSVYFNPLPPHGGRQLFQLYVVRSFGFQSTPSTRRETVGSRIALKRLFAFQSTPSTRRETFRLGFFSRL